MMHAAKKGILIFISHVFVLILTIITTAYSHSNQWLNYTNGSLIKSMVDDSQHIWIGTNGGLVKIDKSENVTTYYNKANSGLPQNSIQTLALDKNKNLWIGTYAGLTKYDGNDWNQFNLSNSDIPTLKINSMAFDSDQNLWMGTADSGLVKFDGSTWSVFNKELFSKELTSIAVDNKNYVWMAVREFGVSRFNGVTWSHYSTGNSQIPSDIVSSIVVDSKNNIWIGASALAKFHNEEWTVYDFNNSDLPGTVSSLSIDAQDNIWVGTIYGMGVSKFGGDTWTNYNAFDTDLTSNYIALIYADNNNNIWISERNDRGQYKLFRYNGSDWKRFETSNSGLQSNSIQTILIDEKNTKWIATRGLVKYNYVDWKLYSPFNNTSSVLENVTGLDKDKEGNLWMGDWLSNTVSMYDGNKFTVFRGSEYNLSSGFQCLKVDRNNNIWIGQTTMNSSAGATPGGLTSYDGTSWTRYSQANSGLAANNVFSIAIDSENKKWIATNTKNVSIFDDISWTELPTEVKVKYIAIDNKDNKWFGTADGLLLYDEKNFQLYNTGNSGLPNNSVNTIFFENEDTTWIGTDGGGLAIFYDDNWQVFNSSNSSLPGNKVYSVTVDIYGNKWIGTNGGIAVYNEDNIKGEENSETPSGKIENYFLAQNYPNPFNQSTTISYFIEKAGYVELSIFDINGRLVEKLEEDYKSPGTYSTTWYPENVASGIYFCRLFSGQSVRAIKCVLVK